MKKLNILACLILLLTSCSKEDPTTYQIINDCKVTTTSTEYLNGSIYEVIVFHYSGEDIIKQDNIDDVSSGGGKSALIEAPTGSEKVKVSFQLLPPESPFYNLSANDRMYVVAFTVLEKGINNVIRINDNTMVDDGLGLAGGTELSSVSTRFIASW
jgi:hypothetical protein